MEGAPMSTFALLSKIADNDLKSGKYPVENEIQMLRAKCNRLAGRTLVIDTTVFKFDGKGECAVESLSNAPLAFAKLLKMNGVTSLMEEAPKEEVKAEEPKKVVKPAPKKEEPKKVMKPSALVAKKPEPLEKPEAPPKKSRRPKKED